MNDNSHYEDINLLSRIILIIILSLNENAAFNPKSLFCFFSGYDIDTRFCEKVACEGVNTI